MVYLPTVCQALMLPDFVSKPWRQFELNCTAKRRLTETEAERGREREGHLARVRLIFWTSDFGLQTLDLGP
eukprot:scaffold7392_cov286-Pinguiococcus_pyrenoidosus.AAC.6